jgi:hypothetical protein
LPTITEKFISMRFFKLFTVCLLLAACSNNSTTKDLSMFSRLHNGKHIILVSCIRCNCMVEELNLIQQQKPALLEPYDIYIDSACKSSLLPAIKTVHISQESIDSLSTDVYNALIIKKKGNGFDIRMLETKDAQKMPKMLAD